MGNVAYTAHISNKKSGITSKSKLQSVAKHNLRKYKSEEYSQENVILMIGTDDLYQDVKNLYHREFDDVVEEYNKKQKRADRKIEDYFEHVAKLDLDMAVEIIFQFGDKNYWDENSSEKGKMVYVYRVLLRNLQEMLPDYKIANAVIHFDEASPHLHVIGVPVWSGAKRGLAKKVSKRNVFTPETLSVILQDKLREEAGRCFHFHYKEDVAEKGIGRNHDLSVLEYKVEKETKQLRNLKIQIHDAEIDLKVSRIVSEVSAKNQERELEKRLRI